jgi:TNF receptor-associated factor 4
MTAHELDDQQHFRVALKSLEQATKSEQDTIDSLEATVSLQQRIISQLQGTIESHQCTIHSLQAAVNILRPKVFVLTEYRKKRVAAEKFQFPPIYTHTNGYHMALAVHADGSGDGTGTHVSVHTLVVEGEHDAGLKWPFVGKVTFTLLNQLEDKNHHTNSMALETTNNAHVGTTWGEPQFILHSSLAHDLVRNTQYLKDDTLYFRMTVEVADHKPWQE